MKLDKMELLAVAYLVLAIVVATWIATSRSAPAPTSSTTGLAMKERPTPIPSETPSPATSAPVQSEPPLPVVPPATLPVTPEPRSGGSQISGTASWYDDGPGFYAAVPSFRFGDVPYLVTVWHGGRAIRVTVRDHCACYVGTSRERVIDLSPEAFSELAPLSRGLVKVKVVRS